MSISRFTDVSGYRGLEWAVIGFHGLVGALFLAGGVRTFTSGGELGGVALQALLGLMIAGLGLVVAQAVSRR